ncbi:MAG: carboxypeptidase regulatory-like domain-containing protein [Bacteroidales bacterium]|nr:MAG: carboxypeptidase regulatory-like domain-containing protein [Bacteroidales bacterium]
MKIIPDNNIDKNRGIGFVLGCLFLAANFHIIYGALPEKDFLYNHTSVTYQISGKIIDISTSAPIQNAKIILLNSSTRAKLSDDIFTDDNGNYDKTLDIDITGFNNEYSELSSTYCVFNSYPNPISAAKGDYLTIQYIVPGDRSETPVPEIYNSLGSKVRPDSYLPAGVYFFRLRFKNEHLTGLQRIMLVSGGKLRITLVQISGKSGLKSSKNKALTKTLTDSIEVLYTIEKNGYIYTERTKDLVPGINNVGDFELVQEGQKSSMEIDSTGGIITVVNDRGDSITLDIPRYAIWNPTTISLTTHKTQPGNPIAENIFPGICITPAGLKLLQPATLKVNFATENPDTSSAALFLIRQSYFILPLGNQTVTDSTISGEIYHFSEIIGGEPTPDEATSQAGNAGGMNPSDPYGWEDTHDCVDALLWWAEFLTRNGRTEEGQECFDKAKEIAERDARDFLDLAIPDDPCGEYLTALLKFAELVMLLVGGDLERQIQDRVIEVVNMCNLRGEIEYDHNIFCTDIDRSTTTKVTGNIPFYVNTLVQPYNAITGGGTAKVTINGPQEECYLTATGIHRVHEITGELKADQQGIYWLEMILDETWYESTTIYVTCPNPENNSQEEMFSFRIPTQVRFLVEDGYEVTIPDFDCEGGRRWILRIIHQP